MSELVQLDDEIQQLAEAQRQNKGTTRLPAKFFIEAIHDEEKSKAAGRTVYSDVEMIEILIGRDVIRHQVTDDDRRSYALQYATWRKGEDQEKVEGMPLSEWGAMPGKALAKEFAIFGIRTVEQLAAATDSTIQRLGPHMALRQKAKDWVADATKQAPLVKLREENEALRNRLAALEGMVSQQAKEIQAARNGGMAAPTPALPDIADLVAQQVQAALAAQKPPRRKPGPKPKVQNGTEG